jgi:hypothetical protein
MNSICCAPLFTATFLGFRNSRAHCDAGFESEHGLVRELLQLNQLFVLEAQLVLHQATPESESILSSAEPPASNEK